MFLNGHSSDPCNAAAWALRNRGWSVGDVPLLGVDGYRWAAIAIRNGQTLRVEDSIRSYAWAKLVELEDEGENAERSEVRRLETSRWPQ